jgi:hypothetical protein
LRCSVLVKTQTVKNHLIDEKVWNESVVPFFLQERGVPDLDRAFKDFNLDDEAILKLAQRIKVKREQKGTKIISSFGEISASFFLNYNEKFILIGLRWPKEMFEIQTGLDIVGVDPKNLDVIYAEVKTSETKKPSSIRVQKADLTEDLKDKRLNSYFLETTREPATKLWIIDLLRKSIQEGKIKGSKETIESIINSKQKYIRYGFLIHTLTDKDFRFGSEFKKLDAHCKEEHQDKQTCNLKCKKTCSQRNPVYFVDLKIEDITKRIDHIIELELTIVAKYGRVDS